MKRVLLGLLLANIEIVLAELVIAPINTVVVRGEEMRMNCVVKNNSRVRRWDFFTTNLQTFSLYLPGKIHSRFSHFGVEVDDNSSGVLYTNSTKLSDAGIYKCLSIIDGEYKEHSAQLTVLESLPFCESNLMRNNPQSLTEGDRIWIQCSMQFRGFWEPTLEWIQHGEEFGSEGKNITHGIETTITPNQSVTSNLTVAIKSSTVESYYSCKIYFVRHNGTPITTANNVPNFTSSAICVSHSTTQSAFTDTTAASSSVYWYLLSMSIFVVVSIFFILMIALARYIRFKRRISASNIPDVANSRHETSADPLYAEVRRTGRAAAQSAQRTPGSSMSESQDAKNSRPLNYFGADGTQYMEVNAFGRQPMPSRLPIESNMYSAVNEYASIDHTLSPPIPPRGKIA